MMKIGPYSFVVMDKARELLYIGDDAIDWARPPAEQMTIGDDAID